jgi:hypothetical protein
MEKNDVCFEINIKHINTLCAQKVEFRNFRSGGAQNNHWDSKVQRI